MKTIVAPNGLRITIEDEQETPVILPDINKVEKYWKERDAAIEEDWRDEMRENAQKFIAQEEITARKNTIQNQIFELEQLCARNIATDAELNKLIELQKLL